MATRIRLRRMGAKKRPFYRVVVADQRAPRDGRFIENIGKYHPLEDPSLIEIDEERALHWLRVGAQPSSQVRNLMVKIGIWDLRRGTPLRRRSRPDADREADDREGLEEGRREGGRRGRGSSRTGRGSGSARRAAPPRPAADAAPEVRRPRRRADEARSPEAAAEAARGRPPRSAGPEETPRRERAGGVPGAGVGGRSGRRVGHGVPDQRGTLLTVRVAPDDMGKVIGRGGRTAKAIRSVVRAAATRQGVSVHVDIAD